MDEHPQRKDWQRIDRLTALPCHCVPGQRHLSDVELLVDRNQTGLARRRGVEIRLDPVKRDLARQQRPRTVIVGNAERQFQIRFHGVSLFRRESVQSAEIFAALIGPAHFSISRSTNLCRYSGERRSGATTSAPISFRRACTAGVSIAAIVASCSFLTMAGGAPFGRKKASQK